MRALGELRVLFICGATSGTAFLRNILSALRLPAFVRVPRTDAALRMLREQGFEVVFCDENTEPLGAVEFVKALRRDVLTRDPTIPVIMISSAATRTQIEALRDAGADDVICKPVSVETIQRKFDQLLQSPRKFVTAKAFLGPDRRRSGDREFTGPDRRLSQGQIFTQSPRLKTD